MANTLSVHIDSKTGMPLPPGIRERGGAYQARKKVQGVEHTATFDTVAKAEKWRKKVEVKADEGEVHDLREARRHTLGSLVRTYQIWICGDDPERILLDDDGQPLAVQYKILPSKAGQSAPPAVLDATGPVVSMCNVLLRDELCRAKLASITPHDASKVRDRMLKDGLSKSSVFKRLNLLARIVQVAKEWDIALPVNPFKAEHCPRPKDADVPRTRVFEAPPPVVTGGALVLAGRGPLVGDIILPGEDISFRHDPEDGENDLLIGEESRLFATLGVSYRGPAPDPWHILAAKIAVLTAMRRGEICALQWGDIDFDRGLVYIRGPVRADGKRRTKNGEQRVIPFLPTTSDCPDRVPHLEIVLRQCWELRGLDSRVVKIGANTLTKRFATAVKLAGLDNFHFHDLRHVATTRLARIFRDSMQLSRITGHLDLQMLKRYYHGSIDDLRASAVGLPADFRWSALAPSAGALMAPVEQLMRDVTPALAGPIQADQYDRAQDEVFELIAEHGLKGAMKLIEDRKAGRAA